jgi:glycosyltransferase involved in cell wall biosynthesis
MTADLGKEGDSLVLHVIPSPRGRGAQRAARLLVDRLDEAGVARHRLLALFDGPDEVDIDQTLGHKGGKRPAEGFDPRLAMRLRKALTRLRPVAVVAHGGDAMKYAVPAVIGTGCPLVYCVIGTYAGGSAVLRISAWKHMMARADLVVAVGDEVLEECTGRFHVAAERAVMIPNGRDPSQYRPRSHPATSTDATLIFVGALTPQKRPDRFVEVVRSLRAEGRVFGALIVGDGPLAGDLAPLAAAQHIEILGPRTDVPDLLRRADALVFPSLPTGEGMPGVLIEAGLSGLPAVSTPVPGAATVLSNGLTGMIVDDSVASLVAAVGQLLDDPDRRVAMGAAARIRCESAFNLDLMAERWRAALRPMVSGQVRAARRGTGAAGAAGAARRRASALRRAMRSRWRSSHT